MTPEGARRILTMDRALVRGAFLVDLVIVRGNGDEAGFNEGWPPIKVDPRSLLPN